jgi:hypothetical protein
MVTPPMAGKTRQIVRLLIMIVILGAVLALASCNQLGRQQTGGPVNSLIIPVYRDGLYRLAFDDLQEAGLDLSQFEAGSAGDSLPRLSSAGVVVPTLRWDDSLIFYGRSPEDRYALYRPYILDVDFSGPTIQSQPAAPPGHESTAAVPFSQTFEENNFYDGRPYGGLPDDPALRHPWYWETIQFQAQVAVDFELPRAPLGPATLTLQLVGVSSNSQIAEDHDLDVIVNGRLLQTVRWDGETAATLPVEVPDGLLQEGVNNLLLDNTVPGAAPIDIARLDRFTVSYLAEPLAAGGQLQTEEVAGALTLTGFQDQPLLFDVSQPDAPVLISGAEFADGRVTLILDKPAQLLAVELAALLSPQDLLARGPSELADSANQADFIIIAPSAYLPALRELVAYRQAQGIATKSVALEQIYQEFADVGVGPAALSAFLASAFNNWSPPQPAYLLLVGDASIDYRNYLGQDLPILVPAPMVPVSYTGETVSDARLADVNGDSRPDLAVGRWPVRQIEEVEALVQRTIEDEGAQLSPTAIFAADGSEARFAEMNEGISHETALDEGQVIYLNGPTGEELTEVWAQGAWLLTYTGHGSLDRWGKDTLLDGDSASALESSGASPVVLQLTCLTGLFAHPTITSLSEEMLLGKNGPVSIIAATSLSLSDHQRPFAIAFLHALQDPNVTRIGDAFQGAKLALDIESSDALREISDTFTLFGDPTALISRPGGQ